MIDLNNLEIRTGKLAPVPVGRKAKNQPILDLYEKSYNEDEIISFDIPVKDAPRLDRALRGYASKTERGITIQVQEKDVTDAKGNPVVMPMGKIRLNLKNGTLDPETVVTFTLLGREKTEEFAGEDDAED